MPMVMVGNKLDLCERINSDNDSCSSPMEDVVSQRAINSEVAQKFAADHGMNYFETSALKDHQVKDFMEHIIESVHKNELAKQNDLDLEQDMDQLDAEVR